MLDATKARIKEERMARKAPLTDADAKALVKSVGEVVVARGKSSRRMAASEATLDDLRGPSGNFRAPMVRKGKTLLVGFSEPVLKEFLR